MEKIIEITMAIVVAATVIEGARAIQAINSGVIKTVVTQIVAPHLAQAQAENK
jgi:hypothetical protein